MVEQRDSIIEYETYLGLAEEWLEGIKSEILGFTHKSPKAKMNHLYLIRATLDNINVSELTNLMNMPWDGLDNPAKKFAKDNKYEKQLAKAVIAAQHNLCLDVAKAEARASGQYETALGKFESKPASGQTFAAFCNFIMREH